MIIPFGFYLLLLLLGNLFKELLELLALLELLGLMVLAFPQEVLQIKS